MILTFDVVGCDDSVVVLLLVSTVDELVILLELESLPVNATVADEPEIGEVCTAEKGEETADVERPESELIEAEGLSLEVDEATEDAARSEVELIETEDVVRSVKSDVID